MMNLIKMLTLVVATVSLVHSVEPTKQAGHFFCYDSPARATWENAFPSTFEAAIRSRKLHHELDEHGEGVIWGWAHWVEIDEPPVTGDNTSAPGSFEFDVVAHLLVFRESWTYEVDSSGKRRKKEWVRRSVCHLKAGKIDDKTSAVRTSAKRVDGGGFELSGFNAAAHSNKAGAHPIKWNGAIVGWVSVAWSAKDRILRTDYRWINPGKNESFAKITGNALRAKKPWFVSTRGNLSLNWAFVHGESSIEKKQAYRPSKKNLAFVLPSSDH